MRVTKHIHIYTPKMKKEKKNYTHIHMYTKKKEWKWKRKNGITFVRETFPLMYTHECLFCMSLPLSLDFNVRFCRMRLRQNHQLVLCAIMNSNDFMVFFFRLLPALPCRPFPYLFPQIHLNKRSLYALYQINTVKCISKTETNGRRLGRTRNKNVKKVAEWRERERERREKME